MYRSSNATSPIIRIKMTDWQLWNCADIIPLLFISPTIQPPSTLQLLANPLSPPMLLYYVYFFYTNSSLTVIILVTHSTRNFNFFLSVMPGNSKSENEVTKYNFENFKFLTFLSQLKLNWLQFDFRTYIMCVDVLKFSIMLGIFEKMYIKKKKLYDTRRSY